jgi:hypothetical protein
VGVTRSTRARATRLRRLNRRPLGGSVQLVWPQPRRLRTQPRSTAPAPRRTLIIASPVLRNSPRRAELWRIGVPEACRAHGARGLVSVPTRSGRLFGAYQEGDSRLPLAIHHSIRFPRAHGMVREFRRAQLRARSGFRARTEAAGIRCAYAGARSRPVSAPTRKGGHSSCAG